MIDYSELHAQIHKITEISNVYSYLVKNRSLCDTEFAGQLLFDYVRRVGDHLEQVDRQIAKPLLANKDPRQQNLARKLIADSGFLRKLITEYLGEWSQKNSTKLLIKDHERFVTETQDIFELVLDRIQRETERLYPLSHELPANAERVA